MNTNRIIITAKATVSYNYTESDEDVVEYQFEVDEQFVDDSNGDVDEDIARMIENKFRKDNYRNYKDLGIEDVYLKEWDFRPLSPMKVMEREGIIPLL